MLILFHRVNNIVTYYRHGHDYFSSALPFLFRLLYASVCSITEMMLEEIKLGKSEGQSSKCKILKEIITQTLAGGHFEISPSSCSKAVYLFL